MIPTPSIYILAKKYQALKSIIEKGIGQGFYSPHIVMPSSTTRSRRSRPLFVSPIKASQPRHCRRCADSPLLTQCMHTASGREFLEQQAEVSALKFNGCTQNHDKLLISYSSATKVLNNL